MATKPIILTLDDDPEVLAAVQRDLRSEYGKAYRIIRANTPEEALDALRQLKLRGDVVALMLVDQKMPGMTGVEFLGHAMQLFPDAKRALLTAYADTNAAIQAINQIRLDHYLMKPWDPPEEHLYPVISDLLEAWVADYRPAFEGVRVIGVQWSPHSHQIKDFLARNRVPYRWLDIEREPEAAQLLSFIDAPQMPVVLFPDGTTLMQPTTIAIAERVGLKTQALDSFYDFVIVGGGPAGLAAAVYGASEGLRTLMIEREAPGGQAGTSSRIENYLGFPAGLSGGDLARRAVAQAQRLGAELLTPAEVQRIDIDGQYRVITLTNGNHVNCHALLIATGVSYKRLPVDNCDRLTGAGVYYGAAATEALAVQGQDVYCVGGGNSAGQAAMFFAKHAANVYVVVRGDSLSKTMSQYLIDQIGATPNIHVLTQTEVIGVHGEDRLEGLTLLHKRESKTTDCPAAALFIFIGAQPHTDWLGDTIQRDDRGFILTGADLLTQGKMPKGWTPERPPYLLETSVPGIFAAGDVRQHSVKRVASAVGEGSIAVQFVHQYLGSL